MSFSRIEYTGDGVTTDYTYSTERIADIDVVALVDGAATGISLVSGNTFRFDVAPVNGAAVVLYRQTDIDATRYAFPNRSYLRHTSLDGNSEQRILALQELRDEDDALAAAITVVDDKTRTYAAGNGMAVDDTGAVITYSHIGDSSGFSGDAHTNLSVALAVTHVLGDIVRTAEYHAGTGVGGSIYRVVAAATGTVDGGSYIDTTDGSGYQLELLTPTGIVSSAQFGALETNADNFTAIDAALAWASANTGTVDDSAAVYDLDRPIKLYPNITYRFGELRNTHNTNSYQKLCILPGNWQPVYFSGNGESTPYTQYATNAAALGDEAVVCTTASDAGNFTAGDIVFARSDERYLSGTTELPTVCGMNVVLSTDAGTGVIKLKHPVTDAFASGTIGHADDNGADGKFNEPLFVCYNSNISGRKLTSVYGNVMERGGMLDSVLTVDEIVGFTGVFTNAICSSKISVGTVTCDRKVIDLAGGSNRSIINIDSVNYRKTTNSTSTPQIAVNENSSDNVFTIGTVDASDFDYDVNYVFLGAARRNKITINLLRTPAHTGVNAATVSFSNSAIVGLDDPRYCTYNEVSINNVVTLSPNYAIRFLDNGGNCDNNAATINKLEGTVVRAIAFEGTKNRGTIFSESGNISTNTASGCTARGYVPDWMSNWNEFYTNDFQVDSTAQQDARENRRDQFSVLNVQTTTVGNTVIQTDTLAAGTLVSDSDHSSKVVLTLSGDITGVVDVKTIRVVDNAGALFTHAFSAGDTGAFTLTAEVFISGSTRYDTVTTLHQDNVATTVTRGSTTGLADFIRSFGLEVWVANAADKVTVRNANITVLA